MNSQKIFFLNRLSDDLYEEFLLDVVDELEEVNQELTSHLINNELLINKQF